MKRQLWSCTILIIFVCFSVFAQSVPPEWERRLQEVEQKLALLDRQVNPSVGNTQPPTIQGTLNELATESRSNKARIESLEQKCSQQEAIIVSLKQENLAQKNLIESQKGEIAALKASLGTLDSLVKAEVQRIGQSIGTLGTKVDTLNSDQNQKIVSLQKEDKNLKDSLGDLAKKADMEAACKRLTKIENEGVAYAKKCDFATKADSATKAEWANMVRARDENHFFRFSGVDSNNRDTFQLWNKNGAWYNLIQVGFANETQKTANEAKELAKDGINIGNGAMNRANRAHVRISGMTATTEDTGYSEPVRHPSYPDETNWVHTGYRTTLNIPGE